MKNSETLEEWEGKTRNTLTERNYGKCWFSRNMEKEENEFKEHVLKIKTQYLTATST